MMEEDMTFFIVDREIQGTYALMVRKEDGSRILTVTV